MSNDYEYLGDSQMAPPMAPRPPTNAPPELITGLPHTPALKANDDVDLESNRPPANNNLSFSDHSVAPIPKTVRSSKSDEEPKSDENGQIVEEKKNHKCGTCWYIFAGVTICLAVICILALGAFLLLNTDSSEPTKDALTGTNGTTDYNTTIFNMNNSTTPLPDSNVTDDISSILLKSSEGKTTKPSRLSSSLSVTSFPSSLYLITSTPVFSTKEVKSTSLNTSTSVDISTSTIGSIEEMKDALPIEETTSVLKEEATTKESVISKEESTDSSIETSTETLKSTNKTSPSNIISNSGIATTSRSSTNETDTDY